MSNNSALSIASKLHNVTGLLWAPCANNSLQIESPIIEQGIVLEEKALADLITKHPLGGNEKGIMLAAINFKFKGEIINLSGRIFLSTDVAARQVKENDAKNHWELIKDLITKAPFSREIKDSWPIVSNGYGPKVTKEKWEKDCERCDRAIWNKYLSLEGPSLTMI